MQRRTALGLLAGAAPLARARAQESPTQGWPNRPLRLVVPFAPGGGADRVARMLADPLSRALGQTIVVENRAGAGGTVAAQHVAASPADGYTLFYGTPGQLTTLPLLMGNLPYDAQRDFAPVGLLIRGAYGIGVHPAVPARSMAELVALARAQPGRLGYATPGVGSGPHLAGELLKFMAGIDLTHIAYRGSALAIQDVVGGQVPISIDSLDLIGPQIRDGRIRGLGVTSRGAQEFLPGVPPVAEALPGYEVTVFNYVAVRAGTPPAVIGRLSREIGDIVRETSFIERNRALATTAEASTPEELGRIWREEYAKWREVITRAGIRIE